MHQVDMAMGVWALFLFDLEAGSVFASALYDYYAST